MSITLGTETLPDELCWIDEFSWVRATASQIRTIGAKLLIVGSCVVNDVGRLITLQNDSAWTTYAQAVILLGWAGAINKTMVLTLADGIPRNVMFRTWELPCIVWTPILPGPDIASTDMGILSLKLVCV